VSGRLAQLMSDTFFYAAGLVLRRGLSLLTLPVFTRYLNPHQFGVLAIVHTVGQLLTVAFEAGVPNATTRFYYDERTDADRRRLLTTLFVLVMGIAIAGALVALWLGPLVWPSIAPDVPFHPYVSLTIVGLVCSVVAVVPRQLFRVTSRVRLFSALSLAQGVFTAGVSIALLTVGDLGVMASILGGLIASAVFGVVFLAYLLPYLTWGFSLRRARSALAFGLPDIPVQVGGWALKVADRLILQAYVPLAAVGLYSLGYTLGGTPIGLIAAAVNAGIMPFFYRMASEESPRECGRIFSGIAAYNAALFAFLALGTMLFAREVILVFATPEYLPAEAVVPLIAWGAVFRGLENVPVRSIYVAKKTLYLPAVFVVPAALNVALNFVLIPRWGIAGAAWATLLSYPALVGLTLLAAQRLYYIPYDYVRIAKPLVIALLLSWARGLVPAEPLLHAIAWKTLLLAAFPVALVLTGFVTPDERRELGRLLRRAIRERARPRVRTAVPAVVEDR